MLFCSFNLHYLVQTFTWKSVSIFSLWLLISCSFTTVLLITWGSQTFPLYFYISLMSYVRNQKVTDKWICFWNPWRNDSTYKVFPVSFLHIIPCFLLVCFLRLVRLLLTNCWFVFHATCLLHSPQCIVSALVWFVTCVCVQACFVQVSTTW